MTACTSLNVNVTAAGSGIDLFRLRTAANGAMIKVLVASNGTLQIRSDFAGDDDQLRCPDGLGVPQRGALRHGGLEHDVEPLPRRGQDRERPGRRTRAPRRSGGSRSATPRRRPSPSTSTTCGWTRPSAGNPAGGLHPRQGESPDMSFPRVTARRLSRVAVVMALTIGLLPIGPSASALTTGALTLNGTSQYVTMGASPGLRSSAVHARAVVPPDRCGRRTGHGYRRHRLRDPADHEGASRSRNGRRGYQLLLRDRRHDRRARRGLRRSADRRPAEHEPSDRRQHGRHVQRVAPRRGHL